MAGAVVRRVNPGRTPAHARVRSARLEHGRHVVRVGDRGLAAELGHGHEDREHQGDDPIPDESGVDVGAHRPVRLAVAEQLGAGLAQLGQRGDVQDADGDLGLQPGQEPAPVIASLLGDRATYRRGNLRRSWQRLQGSPIVDPALWRRLKDYNRPDFHPDDSDTTELVETWRTALFGEHGTLNDKLIGAAA